MKSEKKSNSYSVVLQTSIYGFVKGMQAAATAGRDLAKAMYEISKLLTDIPNLDINHYNYIREFAKKVMDDWYRDYNDMQATYRKRNLISFLLYTGYRLFGELRVSGEMMRYGDYKYPWFYGFAYDRIEYDMSVYFPYPINYWYRFLYWLDYKISKLQWKMWYVIRESFNQGELRYIWYYLYKGLIKKEIPFEQYWSKEEQEFYATKYTFYTYKMNRVQILLNCRYGKLEWRVFNKKNRIIYSDYWSGFNSILIYGDKTIKTGDDIWKNKESRRNWMRYINYEIKKRRL